MTTVTSQIIVTPKCPTSIRLVHVFGSRVIPVLPCILYDPHIGNYVIVDYTKLKPDQEKELIRYAMKQSGIANHPRFLHYRVGLNKNIKPVGCLGIN